jgi:hypothetical protein
VLHTREVMLRTLRAELNFLERGGYRASTSRWRSPYVFEESPSCPNFANPARPHQCKDCWLMRFVPLDSQDEQVPCRYVQLTSDGVTVDSLYRYGTLDETELTLRNWLLQRIAELRAERDANSLPFTALAS